MAGNARKRDGAQETTSSYEPEIRDLVRQFRGRASVIRRLQDPSPSLLREADTWEQAAMALEDVLIPF